MTNRREFLKKATATTAAAFTFSALNTHGSYHKSMSRSHDKIEPFSNFSNELSEPLTVVRIELLERDSNHLCRVTLSNGVEGYAIGNGRLKSTLTLFEKKVPRFFLKRDLRDIAEFHTEFYYFNEARIYKFLGLPIWNSYAVAETAVLDAIGKTTGKNIRHHLGKTIRKKIDIYASSLNREGKPEDEIAWLKARCDILGARAIKIKIGGRMSRNKDASPGWTENLVKTARKTFGDDCTIYVDANGSYDVPKAIEIGRFLEEYNVAFYEEPVEWPDFEGTKKVNDQLSVPIAGGEQDTDLFKWKWMIKNRAVDILQPDIYYNGGLLRTIHVANMAAEYGIPTTTHNPRNNPEYSNILALGAVLPSLGAYQEFRAEQPKNNAIPYLPLIKAKNGKVDVLDQPGMGITFDPDYVKTMEPIIRKKAKS